VLLSALGVALVAAAGAAAGPPPDELLGTWTRTVSSADVHRAHSRRVLPGTTWTLVVGRKGSSVRSAATKPLKGQVVPAAPTLVNIELGTKPDLYLWRRAGKTMILTRKHDPSADRAAILVGSWKRR
jgi:hypothetical protein